MGGLRRRHRGHSHHHIAALLAALILISSATSAEMKPYYPGTRSAAQTCSEPEASEAGEARPPVIKKRSLIGSSPPTCRWRCGRCRPCEAVRVTIHPGISVPLDYYPEAWRCKCRNHLFMP